MNNQKGLLIINLKNYLETAGEKTIKISREAEKVSKELDTEIIISPPHPYLASTVKNTRLKVIAQHVDIKDLGPSTGFIIPEIVKEAGVIGSLINHSEHSIKFEEIASAVQKLRNLGLISIVCVKDIFELRKVMQINPDYIAIEPPELIGTKNSISSEKPYLIEDSSRELINGDKKSKLICGAGINNADDVRIALSLGAKGILAASSIVKAKNWYDKIYELASVL